MTQHSLPSGPAFASSQESLSGGMADEVVASMLATVGDVALLLDGTGRIEDVSVGNPDLAQHGFADLVGQDWAESVTVESKPKVAEMLRDAAAKAPARWRQVNHRDGANDVPVRYLTVAVGTKGRLVAIGRDMRAAGIMQQRLFQTQQTLERDHARLRQAEARYRLLFDMAIEPVLIVDAATRLIRDANPAAQRLLGITETVPGSLVSGIVAPEDREALVAYLGAASAVDDLAAVTVRLLHGGTARVAAHLFRQGRSTLLLVRIVPAEVPSAARVGSGQFDSVIEHMPDAFVLTDSQLQVLTANAAFLEMAGVSALDRVTGKNLGAWLGRPGIDVELITGQLREHGSVRNVSTILRVAGGAQDEIELSGVAAPHGRDTVYGFTLRQVGRRPHKVELRDQDVPRSVEQLTELVGRMSLKDIVRESTDLIERLCIEAALSYTSDNRASAAEILGVSRQSLYSKLHRHGLGNLVPTNN